VPERDPVVYTLTGYMAKPEFVMAIRYWIVGDTVSIVDPLDFLHWSRHD
jgi:hypothetical protein